MCEGGDNRKREREYFGVLFLLGENVESPKKTKMFFVLVESFQCGT